MDALGFAQKINETVEWDAYHWNISPGHLAKMLVLSTFVDLRMTLTRLDDRFEDVDIRYFVGEDAHDRKQEFVKWQKHLRKRFKRSTPAA